MSENWSKAILFVNGRLPDYDALNLSVSETDLLIGVDGGTDHCLTLGFTPHLVVGDMDSLDPRVLRSLMADGVETEIHPVEKDKTDLELALDVALENKISEVTLVGVWGGRLDQSLANILLLVRYAAKMKIRFTDGHEHGVVLAGPDEVVIESAIGYTCSMLLLSAFVDGVSLAGMQFPLRNALLHQGDSLGVSNRITHTKAHCSVQQGCLALVWFDS